MRLARHGPNRLPEPARRSAILRFLAHFHNILIYVLLAAAAITASLGHFIDTGVILAVVIANAIIGYIQEGRAEQAMEAIRQMLAPRTSVLRDGKRRSLDSALIVPGDIVILEAGEKVPADLRLVAANGLRIQEAILTGESVPVEKTTEPVAVDAVLGDRSCMAFSGTLVIGGAGRGVVVATGASSEIGRISGLLSQVETLTTPLIRQMDGFARWLTILILLVAAILLVFGYFVEHHTFPDLFMAVVGLSVAAIPEGLPAVLTITLAIGVQAMARRNAIVRRLPAIETLGSVSVICTDKTGTLTRNEMMVASVAAGRDVFSVDGDGYAPEGTIRLGDVVVKGQEHSILEEFARAAALCNDAVLHLHDDDWTVEGDPMEGALLAFSGKIAPQGLTAFSGWARTDAIPFDARHRYMATLHHDHEGHAFVHLKGAPERVIAMCSTQRSESGGTEPLDKAYWHRIAHDIAAQGQRVLAFATRPLPPEHAVLDVADLEGKLVLIGVVGLIDPPRPEAVAAVAECHGAGIRVKMITGDHAGTAAAIGRQIGLQNPDKVLTGTDLDRMDDAALAASVMETDIFARTSPEHKLRLVMALQSHGLTVAMTGDGVNDAPALKRADAGIAMGRKGSEAAKEASDIVLADDNFTSIVAAIREGRTVYDNIKKVISFELPTSAGEALTIIFALAARHGAAGDGRSDPVGQPDHGHHPGNCTGFRTNRRQHHAPSAAAERRAAPDWGLGLARHSGFITVPRWRIRHLCLCNRQRLRGRARTQHGAEYACGARNLPSLLYPQHLRNVVDLEGGARHQSRLGNGGRHHRRPVCNHLLATPAAHYRHKGHPLRRWTADCRRGSRYSSLSSRSKSNCA